LYKGFYVIAFNDNPVGAFGKGNGASGLGKRPENNIAYGNGAVNY
jgi:hypothetical protein